MTDLLQKAIQALEQLPQDQQNVIAQQILDDLNEDAQWDATLADPRSEVVLDSLIARAKDQVAQGKAANLEDIL